MSSIRSAPLRFVHVCVCVCVCQSRRLVHEQCSCTPAMCSQYIFSTSTIVQRERERERHNVPLCIHRHLDFPRDVESCLATTSSNAARAWISTSFVTRATLDTRSGTVSTHSCMSTVTGHQSPYVQCTMVCAQFLRCRHDGNVFLSLTQGKPAQLTQLTTLDAPPTEPRHKKPLERKNFSSSRLYIALPLTCRARQFG